MELTLLRGIMFSLVSLIAVMLSVIKIIMFFVDMRRRKRYIWLSWIIGSLYLFSISMAANFELTIPIMRNGVFASIALLLIASLSLSESIVEMWDALYWRNKRQNTQSNPDKRNNG